MTQDIISKNSPCESDSEVSASEEDMPQHQNEHTCYYKSKPKGKKSKKHQRSKREQADSFETVVVTSACTSVTTAVITAFITTLLVSFLTAAVVVTPVMEKMDKLESKLKWRFW
ncbi:uncharacterized protein PAC_09081 [Phialocephala subalpina]|uniref:Uncharacterized protein n=1 Tax=Phialocephala subalpina TaxID=576137 RepID=A0A1L7X2G0_9HELO|nr:uncharacterized protein PAC_09081 [Phialocephala subalpina]